MKRCRSKNIDVARWDELHPFIQIDFLLKWNFAHCTHWDAAAMHSSAAIYSAESPGIKPTHTSLPTPTTCSICHPTQALPPLGPPPPTYTPYTCTYRQ